MHRSELKHFCEAQYPRLVGLVGAYCGDADLAEEIAQEALARACRDWKKVRSLSSPEAWVCRVAFNLTHSFFRRKAIERRVQQRVAREGRNRPESVVDVELRDALDQLPGRQRAVLLLRYYLGLSVQEAAEALQCPEGTVKSLTHKAIARLRADVIPNESEAPDAI